MTQDEVRANLGDPHLVITSAGSDFTAVGGDYLAAEFPGMILWVYYVSDDDWSIPAPTFDVSFDQNGVVTASGFVDSVSGTPLPIRQALADADRERRSHCDDTRRIVLDEVVKPGISTEADIQKALGVPHRTSGGTEDRPLVWSYYVGKPSPLRVIATQHKVEFGYPQFDAAGNLSGVTDTDKVHSSWFSGSGCPAL
jgi:hypothetical protein